MFLHLHLPIVLCILFDAFRNVIQKRNCCFYFLLEGLWNYSKNPNQCEKKKSENLGLRETRQRRESQNRATAEMRRAEMGEDRPAVTHKTGTPPLTYQLR